jgi:hypothetical protein
LNFQVVFDLIIQKKIWPVHQRLFAILMCEKKNENFLNFQVVFDLIIQKKIWPVHQRLFAILMCKKKNWDGCTSAPQQFSASLCGGACGFSD